MMNPFKRLTLTVFGGLSKSVIPLGERKQLYIHVCIFSIVTSSIFQ